MKKFDEDHNKIKFLINYDRKKTLSEQSVSLTTNPDKQISKLDATSQSTSGVWTSEKEPPKVDSEYYKQGCSEPGHAIKPPKTMAGNEGILECCCYYPIPAMGEKDRGKIQGMYIPRNSKIQFWGDLKTYNDAIESLEKKYKQKGLNIDSEKFTKDFTTIFPPNTVSTITQYDGTVYYPYIAHSQNLVNGIFEKIYFKGFFNDNKEPFINQVIGDDRNEYQTFIDEWGTTIQWTTAGVTLIGSVIASIFGQAWALPLWAELALEGSIGAAIGIRQIQKGEDVAGYFSFLFGALPALKYLKFLKGYDAKHFSALAEAFQNSKLTSSSHISDYVSFYKKLNKPQREILDKILRGGDIQGKTDIIKQLTKEAAERLPGLLEQGFMKMWKAKPKLFKSIKLFDRLWARELLSNTAVGIAAYLTAYFNPEWSLSTKEGIDPQILDKLDGLFENVPEKLKKEMGYYLMSDPERALEYLKSEYSKQAIQISKNVTDKNSDQVSKGLISVWGKSMQNQSAKSGSEYTPSVENWFESEKMSSAQIENLKKQGYVEKDVYELSKPITDTTQKYDSLRKINNIYYVKPRKQNNNEKTDTTRNQ